MSLPVLAHPVLPATHSACTSCPAHLLRRCLVLSCSSAIFRWQKVGSGVLGEISLFTCGRSICKVTLWKGVTSGRFHLRWLEVPPLGDPCCQVPARLVWFLGGRFCWMLVCFGWTSKGGSSKPREGIVWSHEFPSLVSGSGFYSLVSPFRRPRSR